MSPYFNSSQCSSPALSHDDLNLADIQSLDQWFPIRFKARTPSARKNHSHTPSTILDSRAVSVQTVA